MPTGLIFTTWSITGGGNFDVANPPQALLVAGPLRVLTARPIYHRKHRHVAVSTVIEDL